jgi:outer membrane receptor protein involved in Fe transport
VARCKWTGNLGFFAQDSWKITRGLTLDYGLRWDYQTYLTEEHGRMQEASFSAPNPTVGGLLGAGIYEGHGGGRCDCAFSHNYPDAFGPRVGLAFQINTKTVLRAGPYPGGRVQDSGTPGQRGCALE